MNRTINQLKISISTNHSLCLLYSCNKNKKPYNKSKLASKVWAELNKNTDRSGGDAILNGQKPKTVDASTN